MKCQSKRSASLAGAAWKSGEGDVANSAASRRIRFMVGDLELILDVAMIAVEGRMGILRDSRMSRAVYVEA